MSRTRGLIQRLMAKEANLDGTSGPTAWRTWLVKWTQSKIKVGYAWGLNQCDIHRLLFVSSVINALSSLEMRVSCQQTDKHFFVSKNRYIEIGRYIFNSNACCVYGVPLYLVGLLLYVNSLGDIVWTTWSVSTVRGVLWRVYSLEGLLGDLSPQE